MSKDKLVEIPLAELVLDFNIYPRANVDSTNVADLKRAYEAGAKLPPGVADAKTKRVVDGFHRVTMLRKVLDEKAVIPVILRTYKSEAEMLLDAIALNAHHGYKLDKYDLAHCAILAQNLGIDDELLATAMSVKPEWIGELRANKSAVSGGLHVPIKRTISHMAGRKLTKQQAETNRGLGGMSQLFYVNQLISLLKSGLIDDANEPLLIRLRVLSALLEEKLGVVEA